jgi:hypothetical protein
MIRIQRFPHFIEGPRSIAFAQRERRLNEGLKLRICRFCCVIKSGGISRSSCYYLSLISLLALFCRKYCAASPLIVFFAIMANFRFDKLAEIPKAFVTHLVFCVFGSALVWNVTTTLPLSIVLAAIASLLPIAVLTACIISCGVLLRNSASALQPRITSSLDRLAGTTILGCHAASLLGVCAATAAQLRVWGPGGGGGC